MLTSTTIPGDSGPLCRLLLVERIVPLVTTRHATLTTTKGSMD